MSVRLCPYKADASSNAIRFHHSIHGTSNGNSALLSLFENDYKLHGRSFTFDRVHDADASQFAVFEKDVMGLVDAVSAGENPCVVVLGSNNIAKRFTVEGPPEQPGLLFRCFDRLFAQVVHLESQGERATIKVQAYQIVNEQIRDLFGAQNSRLRFRDDSRRGIVCDGAVETVVRSPGQALDLLLAVRRESNRIATTVYSLILERAAGGDGTRVAQSALTIVYLASIDRADHRPADVAGSQQTALPSSCRRSSAPGSVAPSLPAASASEMFAWFSTLLDVLTCLDARAPSIHYHKSKLTLLLRDILSGRHRGCFIGVLNPLIDSFSSACEIAALLASIYSVAGRQRSLANHLAQFGHNAQVPESSASRESAVTAAGADAGKLDVQLSRAPLHHSSAHPRSVATRADVSLSDLVVSKGDSQLVSQSESIAGSYGALAEQFVHAAGIRQRIEDESSGKSATVAARSEHRNATPSAPHAVTRNADSKGGAETRERQSLHAGADQRAGGHPSSTNTAVPAASVSYGRDGASSYSDKPVYDRRLSELEQQLSIALKEKNSLREELDLLTRRSHAGIGTVPNRPASAGRQRPSQSPLRPAGASAFADELKSLRLKLTKYAAEAKEYAMYREVTEETIKRLRTELDQRIAEVEDCQRREKALESRVRKSALNDRLTQSFRESSKRASELQEEVETLRRELSAKKAEIARLSRSSSASRRSGAATPERPPSGGSRRDNVSGQSTNAAVQQQQQQQAKIERLEAENAELRHRCSQRDGDLMRARQTISKLMEDIQMVKESVLRAQAEEKEGQLHRIPLVHDDPKDRSGEIARLERENRKLALDLEFARAALSKALAENHRDRYSSGFPGDDLRLSARPVDFQATVSLGDLK